MCHFNQFPLNFSKFTKGFELLQKNIKLLGKNLKLFKLIFVGMYKRNLEAKKSCLLFLYLLIIAGYLGKAELAANTIMYIVGGLSYMVLMIISYPFPTHNSQFFNTFCMFSD